MSYDRIDCYFFDPTINIPCVFTLSYFIIAVESVRNGTHSAVPLIKTCTNEILGYVRDAGYAWYEAILMQELHQCGLVRPLTLRINKS